MSLLLRVNLALIGVFAVAATLAGLSCRALLQRNAAQEIHAGAEIDSESARRAFISAARQSLRALP